MKNVTLFPFWKQINLRNVSFGFLVFQRSCENVKINTMSKTESSPSTFCPPGCETSSQRQQDVSQLSICCLSGICSWFMMFLL